MSVKINAKGFRKVCRLVKSSCCNLSDGNCLLLDDGETHTCVQLISKFHIFCNYFKHCVMPLDKELCSNLMDRTDYKTCDCCKSKFYSSAKNKKYCDTWHYKRCQSYTVTSIGFVKPKPTAEKPKGEISPVTPNRKEKFE